jgi:integral membrane protein (TIGR01906 family)
MRIMGDKVKILDIITRWLFILCLPFLFLSASIAICFNSAWLYRYGFNKYEVGLTTGLAPAELDKAARGFIQYWNSGDKYIRLTAVKNGKPFELFNQREVMHLKDVKGLVWLDYRILLLTLIYALAYIGVHLYWRKGKYRQRLVWRVIGGSGITLLIILALGIASALNFDQLFLRFHLLSFANDFWQLDPSTDYLIMLFPEGFWFDTAIFLLLMAGGMAVVVGGVTGSIHFFNKVRGLMGEVEKKDAI